MSSGLEYAVFTELSPDTRPAQPGFNRRIFTDTDSRPAVRHDRHRALAPGGAEPPDRGPGQT
jgi:hypothetical protein